MRKENQRCRVGWSLVVVLALLLSVSGGSVAPETVSAASSGAASVFLCPQSQELEVGEQTTVEIRMKNVSNLYGAEVHLAFDPALLKVVDADLIMAGVQIAPSTDFFAFTVCPDTGEGHYFAHCPDTGGYFVAQAEADNADGIISYAFTLLHPAAPVSVDLGGKVLATITFERIGYGAAEIWFFNPLADEPPVKVVDAAVGAITILPENIKGAVITQVPEMRYTLTVTVDPPDSGTVSLYPEPDPGGKYLAGTEVTLTAEPAQGWQFERWSGDVVGTESTITLTMDADKSVTAHFTAVDDVPSVRIQPESQTVAPGDTFTVDLMVDATGFSLRGLKATVTFDALVMSTSDAQVTGHNLLEDLGIGPTIEDNTVTYAMATEHPGQPDILGSMLTIEFTVNSDASPGTYNLTLDVEMRDHENVEIIPVFRFPGTVTVGHKGDFDGDREIGLFDFVEFAGAFGLKYGDANYNPIADFDNDGEVGLFDFVEFAGIFGTTY